MQALYFAICFLKNFFIIVQKKSKRPLFFKCKDPQAVHLATKISRSVNLDKAFFNAS